MDPAALRRPSTRLPPEVATYSPRAEAGRVGLRDRLPGFIGLGMGILLWMVILTGAGILLNSVIEEKSSRILEVLLSSASVAEIMGGKILGVAGGDRHGAGRLVPIGGRAAGRAPADLAADRRRRAAQPRADRLFRLLSSSAAI